MKLAISDDITCITVTPVGGGHILSVLKAFRTRLANIVYLLKMVTDDILETSSFVEGCL